MELILCIAGAKLKEENVYNDQNLRDMEYEEETNGYHRNEHLERQGRTSMIEFNKSDFQLGNSVCTYTVFFPIFLPAILNG